MRPSLERGMRPSLLATVEVVASLRAISVIRFIRAVDVFGGRIHTDRKSVV